MNLKRFIISLVLVGLILTSSPVFAFDKNKAEKVWQDFQTLVKNKEYEKAYQLIYLPIECRKSFQELDPYLKSFAGNADSIKVLKIETQKTFIEIQSYFYIEGREIYRNFYIIEQDEKYYLTMPWYALTWNWKRKDSENFIFIYNPEKENPRYGLTYPTDLSIRLLEEHYMWLLDLLDIDNIENKIKIYMVNSPQEVGKLIGTLDIYEATSYPPLDVCVSIFPFGVFHEICHIVLYKKTGMSLLPGMLHHGFPEYGDGDGGAWKRHLSTYWVRKRLKEKGNISLNEIRTYPETTSFTKYLIEEWGRKRYRELLLEVSQNPDSLPETFEKIYQITFKDLEQDWIDWIKRNHETQNEIDIERRINFRIIVDTWERRKIGRFTIYCDSRQKFPKEKEIKKLEKKYIKHCREKGIEPFSNITFYLVNNGNRMRGLFSSEGKFFQKANIMADTTFTLRGIFK